MLVAPPVAWKSGEIEYTTAAQVGTSARNKACPDFRISYVSFARYMSDCFDVVEQLRA